MRELVKSLFISGITSPVVWALLVGVVMVIIHALAKSKSALVDAILSKAVGALRTCNRREYKL